MADIKASQVKELRERTGAGMMECKSALVETNGDMEEAVKVLRKKGLAAASKKAGRVTSEGLVAVVPTDSATVVVEVNCETDFVAGTDDFRGLVDGIGRIAADSSVSSIDELLAQPWPGDAENHSVSQVVASNIAKIGENISVRRFAKYAHGNGSVLGSYVHGKGSIGAIVELAVTGDTTDAWSEVARELAMHVAAADPRFARRDEVKEADLEAEREIAREQAAKSGKPPAVIEKIVTGKMEKFYAETVLLEQAYIRDDKKSVAEYVAGRQKEIGGTAEVKRFTRFKLGEGLDKRSDDFVSEVMAQANR